MSDTNDIDQAIRELKENAEASAAAVGSAAELENFRIEFLARKGRIAVLFDRLRDLPQEQKPRVGKELNELRMFVDDLYRSVEGRIKQLPAAAEDSVDLTLPGRASWQGSLHPVTRTLEDIKSIFVSMGFEVADSPEIEDDYHNFEALNFPPDHPARDMQDTFFLEKNAVLRTHTSPGQIRVMERERPPIRVIVPGRVYRNEAVSARSYCVFHQVEGLFVDENVTFSELKGTLVAFARMFYGKGTRYRFRPSFFPFTEPSLEMDIRCFLCSGIGCRMCKQTGWLEILGAGMVHPNVFRHVRIDAEKYTGFAFGMGIERTTILRHGIPDIRMLFENDMRFLKQF